MACPMALDLSPHSVKAAKDVGAKKPRLYIAAACLLAGLGSITIYNKSAASAFARETGKYELEVEKFAKYDDQIKAQEKRQKIEETRVGYLANVINQRSFWINMMNALNAQFANEKIWITQISMVGPKGEQTVDGLFTNAVSYGVFGTGVKATTTAPPVKGQTMPVTAIHIAGINRGVGEDVPTLFAKIRENLKDYFEFDSNKTDDDLIRDYVYNQVGSISTKEGYDFQMLLPLKQKMDVPVPVKPITKK
jgi:hypothetical protein